jgi:protein-S-isoprenylcysteine O-methyltransferase Ste14
MELVVQLVVALLVGAVARLIFGRVAREYRAKGRLGPISTLLEFLIFALHGTSSYLYLDLDLARVRASGPLLVLGAVLLVIGLFVVLVGMGRLGWGASMGRSPTGLRQQGLYSLSRNPQLVAYGLMLVGCVLLWPSWAGLIWLTLYGYIAHIMVGTEEEHLSRLFGEEYRRYCERTPRYIGFLRAC